MNKFDRWWVKEEANILRSLVGSDGTVMDDMHSVAMQAWDAACDKAADSVILRMDVISDMMEKQAGTQEGATLRSMWMNLSSVLSSIKEMKND